MSRLFTFQSHHSPPSYFDIWYSDYTYYILTFNRVSAWGCLRKILNSKYFVNGIRGDQQEDDGVAKSTRWRHVGEFEWRALDSGIDCSAVISIRQFVNWSRDHNGTELTTGQAHVLPNCLKLSFVLFALFEELCACLNSFEVLWNAFTFFFPNRFDDTHKQLVQKSLVVWSIQLW